jgi:predicted DNA-binding transcriptional regulator AlpA
MGGGMQTATIAAVMAALAALEADGTVGDGHRQRLAALLQGGLADGAAAQDRILRRHEAARLLGRSPKSVDRLAAAGVIQRVTFPGHIRAAGFRLSDVNALVAGGHCCPDPSMVNPSQD